MPNKYLLVRPRLLLKSSRKRRRQVSRYFLVIRVKYCLHRASGKIRYPAQRRDNACPRGIKGWLRKLRRETGQNYCRIKKSPCPKDKWEQKRSKRARAVPVQFPAYLVAFETRPFIGGSLVDNVILCCCYISFSLPEPSPGFSRLRILRSGSVSRELLSGSASFALCVMFPGACFPGVEKVVVKAMLTSAGANF